MMTPLYVLISWLRRVLCSSRVDFATFKPSDDAKSDPRTVVVPLRDRPEQMDFFDVANAFARERIRFKKLLLQAHSLNAEAVRDAGLCEFGVWLRFVEPAPDKRKLLSNIALWHEQWHAGAKEAARLLNAGERAKALQAYHSGRCHLSATRVGVLLEQFWEVSSESAAA